MNPAEVVEERSSSALFTGSARSVEEQGLLRAAGSEIGTLRDKLVENERKSGCVRANLAALQACHAFQLDELRDLRALGEQATTERDTVQAELRTCSQTLSASQVKEEAATAENRSLNTQVANLLGEAIRVDQELQEAEQS